MHNRFMLAVLGASLTVPAAASAQVVLPFSEGFEGTNQEIYQVDTPSLTGAPDWAFETDSQNEGRLRMGVAGFPQTGTGSATLDETGSSGDTSNFLILTLDMTNYNALAADAILLSFSVLDHGEEADANDRVWVRGSNAGAWVEIANLTTPNPPNGVYTDFEFLDVSAALTSAGQNFSATTQIRFGQQDNSTATSLSGGDGLTFDDILIEEAMPDAEVLAILTPVDGDCGDANQMITVEIGAGAGAISNVPVQVDVTGAITATFNDVIAGPIPPGGTATLTVGPIDTTVGGIIDITATATLPTDADPTNDVLLEAGLEMIGALVPINPIPTACPGYPVELSVVPELNTSYEWFDVAVGGTAIATGTTYTTPAIPAAGATYFVERVNNGVSGGAANNSIGGGGGYSHFPDGLRFDATGPTTISGMTVYPSGSGDIVLNLRDSTGTILDTETVAVAPSTAYDATPITVSLSVPAAGTGYELDLVGTTVPQVWRTTGGAVYPYPIGPVTITGPINNLNGFYYFFYDIQVGTFGCPGPRVQLPISAGAAGCEADLSVSLVEPTGPLVAGQQYSWTVDVVNNGPHDATGVSLGATPDAAATFISNAGDCTVPFACALTDLAPGATAQVVSTYEVGDAFDVTTLFEQTFEISAAEADPAAGDESATSSLAVERHADLVITMTTDPDPPVSGGILTYLVDVTNNGPSEASGVVVSMNPGALSILESVGCAEDPNGGAVCTIGDVPVGSTLLVEFDVQVPPEQVDAFSATATVTSTATELAPGDETVTVEATPVQEADVSVTIVEDADPVRAGADLTYTVTVVNAGPSSAADVELVLAPDAALTLGDVTGCAGTTCAIGALAPLEERAFTVVATVAADASGTLSSTASVTSTSTDPDATNDSATEETAVDVAADLSLTGSADPTAPTAGVDEVNLTLTAANAGPAAVDATVSITVPEGLEQSDLGGCTGGATVECAVTLAVGGEQELTLSFVVPTDAAEGIVQLVAEIAHAGTEASAGDETVSIDIDIQANPDAGDDDDAAGDDDDSAGGDDDDDDDGGGDRDACACESSLADASSTSLWAMLFGALALGLRRRR